MTIAPPATVLVVEDETLIRMMLTEALGDAGYHVVEAENADEGVVQLERDANISLVITDVRMPGSIDGLGLACWMRQHRPKVPVIVASGFVTAPDIADINPAIVRVVAKPYLPNDAPGWIAEIVSGTGEVAWASLSEEAAQLRII